jgi:hypothetical protein
MGYTHYFAYDPNAESFVKSWPQIVTDAHAIGAYVQQKLGIRLADGMGDGHPEFTERWIYLNGPSRRDLGHETFLIDPTPWKVWDEQAALGHRRWADHERQQFEERGFLWAFCKTARKPYDIAVTSILLRCRHLAPDAFVIGSDGHWEREWQHGAMYWGPGCEPGRRRWMSPRRYSSRSRRSTRTSSFVPTQKAPSRRALTGRSRPPPTQARFGEPEHRRPAHRPPPTRLAPAVTEPPIVGSPAASARWAAGLRSPHGLLARRSLPLASSRGRRMTPRTDTTTAWPARRPSRYSLARCVAPRMQSNPLALPLGAGELSQVRPRPADFRTLRVRGHGQRPAPSGPKTHEGVT